MPSSAGQCPDSRGLVTKPLRLSRGLRLRRGLTGSRELTDVRQTRGPTSRLRRSPARPPSPSRPQAPWPATCPRLSAHSSVPGPWRCSREAPAGSGPPGTRRPGPEGLPRRPRSRGEGRFGDHGSRGPAAPSVTSVLALGRGARGLTAAGTLRAGVRGGGPGRVLAGVPDTLGKHS